jgi:serine/threonine protein kinase
VPQLTLEPLRRWDPDRIGPYSLLGRLGAGAMGQVYLGRSASGRLVAVKTIKIELAEEAGFRDHFAHEVAAARRVSGLFTAAVVAADPDADVPWLATAYLPAPSLSRLVRSCGPQPVETIWWLAAGCAEALESIHTAGLVHRDLKPSNVLVAPDGPRVIDFGVARAAERIQLTVTHGAVGTPAYMAPEQARDTRQASAASDVFALGATLLYAATGHPPYQGETVMDILVRLATEPPDLAGLPAELSEIVLACLQRSPRDRPTSAALLKRLGPLLARPAGVSGGHAYLTDQAMELIAEYQHSPQLDSGPAAGDTSHPSDVSQPSHPSFPSVPSDPSLLSHPSDPSEVGATYASQLAVPNSGAGQAGRRGLRGRRRRQAPAADDRWPGEHWTRSHQAAFPLVGRAAAAFLLIGAGAALGALLRNSPPPVKTTVSTGPRATVTVTPPPLGDPTFPGPGGQTRARKPKIAMLQPQGDGDTGFVVHGVGWQPGRPVTIELTWRNGSKVSVLHPIPDIRGIFNYTIDQSHVFFPGRIPVGEYHVIVTAPGGRRATTRFAVIPPRGDNLP